MSLTRINNNIAAISATRNLNRTTGDLEKSLERLSSGLRINRASDDASGLSISEKLRTQIRGLNQAIRNAQDAVSLVNTAEGALDETTAILQRVRELAVKAANTGGLDANAIQAAQDEIDSAIQEITRIGTDTQFSTRKLLNGSNAITAEATSGYGVSVSQGPATSSLAAGTHYLSIEQTTAGSETVTSGGDGANIGTGGTIDESTFDTGSYTITVSNTQAGVQQAVSTDAFTGSGATVSGGTDLVDLYNGAGGTTQLVITDDIVFSGTTSDGTAFDGAFDILAASDLDALAAAIETEINNANAASTDDDVSVSVVSGAIVVEDLTAMSSSQLTFSLGVNLGGAGASTGMADADHTITTTQTATAQLNTAVVSVGGGPAQTVQSGQTVTFYGQEPSSELDPTPQMTITFGTLSNGDDTVAVVQEEWTGSLDGGNEVTFQNGDENVVFKNGTSAGYESGEFVMLNLDAALTSGTVSVTSTNNGLNFHIGANENQGVTVGIGDVRASNLGLLDQTGMSVADIDVKTYAGANDAISIIDEAIEQVSRQRSYLGAISNRLDQTINNLGVSAENLTASESRIRDADVAYETTRFTRNQILLQAGTAILAQANIAPQAVLQLLG